MDKLKMHSPNLTEANIEKLAQLFPNCVTEATDGKGGLKKAIDFDLLRQELSDHIVDGPQERYQLSWPGKREALLTANLPIVKTLRPCIEESVDFEVTRNIFIEGDNLDALKLIQETYLNKVKMIYIDPPYNTGKDFIYSDSFSVSSEEYFEKSNQVSAPEGRLVANTESNGRFHSDWLSMLYSRLKLARNVLRQDGVIFISIDDNEISNLQKIADEVFGEENLRGILVWQHSVQPKGYSGTFSVHHNFILCYARSEDFELANLERTDEHNKNYSNPDNDPNGKWRAGDVRNALYRPNLIYKIKTPSGKEIDPPQNGWRWSKETLNQKINSGEIIFSQDETRIIRKIYLNALDGRTPETILFGKDVGTTRDAASEIKSLFDGEQPFDTPKPVNLVRHLIMLSGACKQDLIMDFFAGSSTTAHAVALFNVDSNKQLRSILVQIPELCDETSTAFKLGYKNISEISKERIRRAGKKIKEENAEKEGIDKLDIGFRVLKIDTSNMKEVYYSPDAVTQDLLADQVDNIREDRTPEDLLFQVLLDWGVDLALPISQETIAGKNVFFVDGNALVACFDKGIDEAFVKEIAAYQPLRVVFRDNGFASDSVKINVEQLFKLLSPMTEIKTL
ncbi:site-specific DNA-methyltransferase [Azotobacter chroococcum]|uniref:site-specific DNA-methyltransferase n=1 Tax=Azotobacter chroococcum TaxID=353 RepID=UPI0010AE49C4|nr:site-specific DNA-methyltransferase [Azotobacter chroococcum]TKD34379.1 site-specific DNA-methyltransferase [Azotobacter chroococcum]